MMNESFDREKVIDCMFDPVTSSILADLEDGERECNTLAQNASITESQVLDRLSYLIEHGFINKRYDDNNNDKCFLSAVLDKLTSVVEDGDNFGAAVDGLEKMDSYLN